MVAITITYKRKVTGTNDQFSVDPSIITTPQGEGLYDSGTRELTVDPWFYIFGMLRVDRQPVFLKFWQRQSGGTWSSFVTEMALKIPVYHLRQVWQALPGHCNNGGPWSTFETMYITTPETSAAKLLAQWSDATLWQSIVTVASRDSG